MRNELHARHPRRRPSARIAILAGAMIAGYVPRTMTGDLGPLCPLPGYPDRRCLTTQECCFGHLCCYKVPSGNPCCSGTFEGQTYENCIYPDTMDCCSGVAINEGWTCCNDEGLNNVQFPYGCPPDGWECCDGATTFETICTPPGYECCRFGNGAAAPDAGACCRDGVGYVPNYVCGEGEDCCKGPCCGGDYPTCCQDVPDPPPPDPPYPGYCCQAGEGCCQGECCAADTPVCCTDGTDPFDPRYCCETGESCCGGVCCAADRHCCPIGPPSCGPVGACCLDNEGGCTEVDQTCCDRMGGIAWAEGVPCDSSPCLPMCDNCQEYQRTFDECLHWANDPNGTPCLTYACIHNEVCTASCTHHDGRIGTPRCDTDTIWGLPEVRQSSHWMACPGGVVSWHVFFEQYAGCGDTCEYVFPPFRDSCVTGACSGPDYVDPIERGDLRVCGCPP